MSVRSGNLARGQSGDMIERVGNLWECQADWLCIPTNGERRANGSAVMGAGLAKQAMLKCHGVDVRLGKLLAENGNHTQFLGTWAVDGVSVRLISFPTKTKWRESSDIDLIRRSAKELRGLLLSEEDVIALPRVGTGCGNLGWGIVRPVLKEELPEDRFIVVSQ